MGARVVHNVVPESVGVSRGGGRWWRWNRCGCGSRGSRWLSGKLGSRRVLKSDELGCLRRGGRWEAGEAVEGWPGWLLGLGLDRRPWEPDGVSRLKLVLNLERSVGSLLFENFFFLLLLRGWSGRRRRQEVGHDERRLGLRLDRRDRRWRWGRSSCGRGRWWSGCRSSSCCCGSCRRRLNEDSVGDGRPRVQGLGSSFLVSGELREVLECRESLVRVLTLRPRLLVHQRAALVDLVFAVVVNDLLDRRRGREPRPCSGRVLGFGGRRPHRALRHRSCGCWHGLLDRLRLELLLLLRLEFDSLTGNWSPRSLRVVKISLLSRRATVLDKVVAVPDREG